MPVKRLLVPVDFSPDSLNALDYAQHLARGLGAEILILHVVDQTYLAGTRELAVANPAFAQLLNDQWHAASVEMDHLRTALKKRWPRCRSLVARGTPWQVIVETAKRTRTDLIVLGSHGRTGVAHVLIGSVAERVVRLAPCAVLTVRRRPAARVIK